MRIVYVLLFLSFCIFSDSSIAQQIQFVFDYREPIGMKPGFNNRFFSFNQAEVKFGDPAFYKLKKVKSITIFGERKNKLHSFDLDTNGNVLKTGVQEHYFKTSECFYDKDSLYCSVTCFWENEILVRTDTNRLRQFEWKSNDTLLFCSQREIKINKIGYLINEQNRFYNEQYLNKKIKLDNPPMTIHLEGKIIQNPEFI